MKIYLGADHAGYKLKEKIKLYLVKAGRDIEDVGNIKLDPNDDYPDFGYKVSKKVSKKKSKGILICGSSYGVCIVANKVRGIRAVSINNVKDAKLSREHNDANVICLSGWNLSAEKAKKIINMWLNTPFSKAKRHKRRVNKIKKYEVK